MGSRGIESRRRLEQAALKLYRHHGYGEITAAQIAERAGLTERTFFRHFADKREMLFANGSAMEQLAIRAIQDAAPAPAFQLAITGLRAVAPLFEEHPDLVRERQRIIDAHVDLQERELTKRNQFSDAIGTALRDVGASDTAAALTGALAGVVFHDAFVRWLREPTRELAAVIDESASSVRQLTAMPVTQS